MVEQVQGQNHGSRGAAKDWAESVLEILPELWGTVCVFAPLLVDVCGVCGRVRSFLWLNVGNHAACDGQAQTEKETDK